MDVDDHPRTASASGPSSLANSPHAHEEDVKPVTTPPKTSNGDWRKNKRTRKAYSCIPCHKRKVKCDRTRPCHGCVKRGEPSACVWETEEPNADLPGEERDKLLARIRDLETTLVKLRRGDASAISSPTTSSSTINATSPSSAAATSPSDDHAPFWVHLPPPKPHPLAAYTQGGLLDEPKAFPFSSLWEGDDVSGLFDILPAKDGSDRILNIFYTHIDPAHPVFSRASFSSLYEAFYLLPPSAQASYHPAILAMFFSAFSLGVLFSGGDERVKKMPYEVLPGESVTQARQRAARATAGVFASASWHALRAASFLSNPSIHSVAALIWLELYLMHEDRPRDTWILHGMTYRMTVLLLQEPGQEEAKERLWRYIVFQEAYLSLSFGQPGIPLSNLYPRPMTTLPAPSSPGDTDAQYEPALHQLALIMERVVANRSYHLPPSEVLLLDKAIRAWKAALPLSLSEDSPSFDLSTATPRVAHQTMKLAFEYHHMHMFLHRGYAERYAAGTQEYMYAKEMFAQAVHGIVARWLETYRIYPETFIANVWLGQVLLLASLESCDYVLRHPEDEWREQAKADVHKAIAVYHQIKATNPVAAKALTVLEERVAALD